MNNWIMETKCQECGLDTKKYEQMEKITAAERGRVLYWTGEIERLEKENEELKKQLESVQGRKL